MNNHGHVRPNQDGSRARCGGPGICMECSLEADAYKLSAMGGCNSCNDLESKLSAAEKERDELRERLALAIKKLEKIRNGPGNRMKGWFATWAHEFADEALKAINGGE